jgi:hypothetical protein
MTPIRVTIGREVLWGRFSHGWDEVRVGAYTLRLATDPTNREILFGAAGRNVEWIDGQEYTVSAVGEEALFVSGVAERWLRGAPDDDIDIDGDRGQAVLGALIDGWCAAIVHALAAAPATRPELEASLDPPSAVIRERLRRMWVTGLLAAPDGSETDEDAVYAPTDWLRRGIAPLLAAAQHELRNKPEDAAPPTPLDVEAAFRLALPLLRLREGTSGSCALAVFLDYRTGTEPCGVTARFEDGRAVAIDPDLDPEADARITGSIVDWLDTVVTKTKRVRAEGDRVLAGLIRQGLHRSLFG